MMYGFGPVVPASSYAAPVINIWAFKVNGVDSNGVVGTGMTEIGYITSNNKGNSLVDLLGDFSYSGLWYGFLNDSDWADGNYANWAGFQNVG